MAPKKWFYGCCQKRLGEGSKICPPLWCHVCGWVHFNCSGLKNKSDYHDNFLCPKWSKSRVLIENDDSFAVASKIHKGYTNPDNSTAPGSREKFLRGNKCSSKHVDRYLNSSETSTKFKLTRKRFPRLKLVSFWPNEVWSIDLADMQQLSTQTSGVRYLFVAVDTLSRFLWVVGVKSKDLESLYRRVEKNNSNQQAAQCSQNLFIQKLSRKDLGWSR